jgi:Zn-dependent protease with chaperone function
MNVSSGPGGQTCPECGAVSSAESQFCGQCGAGFPDPSPDHQWMISVPMLNNRFMLYDLVKLLVWTGLIIAILMFVMLAAFGDSHDLLESYFQIMRMFGYVLAGFAVMFLAIMLLFFGNRYRTGFTIDRNGVGWSSMMSRTRWANRAAVVAGILAAKPGVAGAGLLAQSQEQGIVEWDEIRKLKFYPALCSISVMNSWRVVIRLNCTPEQYPAIAETLKRKAAKAAVQILGLTLALLVASGAAWAKPPKPAGSGLNFFSEEAERSMGRRYAEQLNSKLAFVTDPSVSAYVSQIGRRLAAASPRPSVQYEFRVVNTKEVNAFAVPGGFIYVNRGLIELSQGEDELAAVLAHEIGHVAARHGTRQLSKQMLLQGILIGSVAATSAKSKKWGDVAAMAGTIGTFLASMKYSRNDEYQADALALDILASAGYRREALVRFFERMDESSRRSNRAMNFLALVSTHPPASERIRRVELSTGPVPRDLAFPAPPEFAAAKSLLASLPAPPPNRDVTLSAALRSVGLAESRKAEEATVPGCADPGPVLLTRDFTVSGSTVWLNTGLNVGAGQTVNIESSGEIYLRKDSTTPAGPDGLPGTGKGFWKPLSWADTGALLARVEAGENKQTVLIGGSATFCVPFDYSLALGINDDNNFDNRGQFNVRVTIRQRGPQ